MTRTCDIVVAGAGPTGMAAALEAAACGYDTVLAAPSGTHLDDDARTTALMRPGIAMLENYGVWPDCAEPSAPLKVLRIVDATGRLFRAPTVSFRASEADLDAFGYNIPNRALNAALEKAVQDNPRIAVVEAMVSAIALNDDAAFATLSNGETFEARLVIGADGVNSLVRQAASIGARKWAYPQTAIVLAFDHERPHGDISTEYHTEQGPFTQVPLPGNRSSLVWVMRPERVHDTLAMAPRALAMAIEENLHFTLGKVSGVTEPQTWPLSSLVAHRFGARRVMLIGQAAHAFPPIGAQGLNLGFRDVADLAAVLAGAGADPGAPRITRSYDWRRRADVYTRTGAVDLLNRSLLTDFVPIQMGRAAGLGLLKNFGPLRGIMMREGVEPGASVKAAMAALDPRNLRKGQAAG
ncbi:MULTISPECIES: UbiH/UbiF family hydroxylase [unclassified Roseitalea]|uniref:UbiH/UbiF family hydroxylase n=1 Tax=unclassified Roseitalea TaxID=2639107 RepID=UPI00273F20EB|nr:MULTISPECIES: UbiH/UbiF family hydroxylase [unclassified Roseitalea]